MLETSERQFLDSLQEAIRKEIDSRGADIAADRTIENFTLIVHVGRRDGEIKDIVFRKESKRRC
jgi:hypothetical protein